MNADKVIVVAIEDQVKLEKDLEEAVDRGDDKTLEAEKLKGEKEAIEKELAETKQRLIEAEIAEEALRQVIMQPVYSPSYYYWYGNQYLCYPYPYYGTYTTNQINYTPITYTTTMTYTNPVFNAAGNVCTISY